MPHEIDQMDRIQPVIVTTRIIVVALAAGIAFFGAFVLVFQGIDLQADLGVLTLVAIILGCSNAPLSFFVANQVSTHQIQQIIDDNSGVQARDKLDGTPPSDQLQRLAQVFQTKTLIACAVLDGAAFFALVALLLEDHVASLAVAAVMLALILSHFPSSAGVTHWIEQRRQHIEHFRQLSH